MTLPQIKIKIPPQWIKITKQNFVYLYIRLGSVGGNFDFPAKRVCGLIHPYYNYRPNYGVHCINITLKEHSYQ